MSEEVNWVFLRSFVWPHEYYTLQVFLASNGISVYMRDEITITIDPLLSHAMGGIKMFVEEQDFECAVTLLAEFDCNRDNDTNK